MCTKKQRSVIIAVAVVFTLTLTPAAFAVVQDGDGGSQIGESGQWAPIQWFVEVVKSILAPGVVHGPGASSADLTDGTSPADEDAGPSMDPSGNKGN